MDPPVYLLDEPTSALDSDTERRVMKQFTILAREKKKQLSSSHTHNNFQKKLRTILLRLVKQTVQLERKCSQLKGVIELQIWQLVRIYFHSYFNWTCKIKRHTSRKTNCARNVPYDHSARTRCICPYIRI